MMSARPRIGLLTLSAGWFREIGADQGSFAGLGASIENDARRICSVLESHFDVIGGEVLDSREGVEKAVRHMVAEEVEGIIACNVTWGEDQLLIDALDRMNSVPLLLWCYTPFERLPERMNMSDLFRSSGTVGAVQASAPLRRLDRNTIFVVGSCANERTVNEISSFARAAKVARSLKNLRVGVLPYRCDQMTGTYVDEFRLKKELGPELVYISVAEYKNACDAIGVGDAQNFVRYLRSECQISDNIHDESLEHSARASLGLGALAIERGLGAIALNDVSAELHRVVGFRPCLGSPQVPNGFVVSMEADVCGALSLWILNALTGQAVMYSEIFTFDEYENSLLIGHAGLHDIRLAKSDKEIFIETDGEYVESEPDSCWMSFRVKPGQVTLLSTFCDVNKFKFVSSAGESIDGDRKLLGSPHACVRLQRPVHDFLRDCLTTGMTQHWAMTHGQAATDIRLLGQILDLDTLAI